MAMLDTILRNVEKTFNKGLQRKPQEYIYLDTDALYEHYKAITGMDRIPVGISQSTSANSNAGLFGISIGAGASNSTSFEMSEPHLFESLEPVLREKYNEIKSEQDVIDNFREFCWFKGDLFWQSVGPTRLKDEITDRKRIFYILYTAEMPFIVLINEKSFSPFSTYLSQEPDTKTFDLKVEILAYNTGALGNYGLNVHHKSGKSLLIIPTVILLKDKRTNEELAIWLREYNDGKLSRFYPHDRKPGILSEQEE